MNYKVGSLSSFISGVTVSSNKSVVYKEKTSKQECSARATPVSKKIKSKRAYDESNVEGNPSKKVRFAINENPSEPEEPSPSLLKNETDQQPISHDSKNSVNALRRIQLKQSKNQSFYTEKVPHKTFEEQTPRLIDEEKESRTVFVKNLPHHLGKTKIKKLFRKFGEIESVRLRCAPVSDVRVPKKVAVIKNQFHSERSTICAFICFKSLESASEALNANGMIVEEHHLFVDKAIKAREYDQRKCIFLGNVSFSAEEEEIWEVFEKCGKILDIRIVREAKTGIGKGFAYVTFENADAVELALNLNGAVLKKRPLRVSRAVRKKKTPIYQSYNKTTGKTHTKIHSKTTSNSVDENFNKKKSKKKGLPFQGQMGIDRKNKQRKRLGKDERRKKSVAMMLTGEKKLSRN